MRGIVVGEIDQKYLRVVFRIFKRRSKFRKFISRPRFHESPYRAFGWITILNKAISYMWNCHSYFYLLIIYIKNRMMQTLKTKNYYFKSLTFFIFIIHIRNPFY